MPKLQISHDSVFDVSHDSGFNSLETLPTVLGSAGLVPPAQSTDDFDVALDKSDHLTCMW